MEITSELHAARILTQLHNNEIDIAPHDLEISDWANVKIHIPGEAYVLQTNVMRSIIALQDSLYRGSAVILDGTPNIAYLSARQKERLTFKTYITEGSTDAQPNVSEALLRLIPDLVNKLSAKQIVRLVLVAAVTYGGTSVLRTYADHSIKGKELDMQDAQNQRLMGHIESHSEHDKEVIKALVLSGQQSAKAAQVQSVHQNAIPDIIKGLKDEKKSSLNGMPLTPSTVDAITRSPKAERTTRQLVGTYRILNVDATTPTGFRVRVENIENGEAFTAGLEDATISHTTRAVIESATFKKTDIAAIVSAKIKNGSVVDAKITSAQHVEDEEE